MESRVLLALELIASIKPVTGSNRFQCLSSGSVNKIFTIYSIITLQLRLLPHHHHRTRIVRNVGGLTNFEAILSIDTQQQVLLRRRFWRPLPFRTRSSIHSPTGEWSFDPLQTVPFAHTHAPDSSASRSTCSTF